MNIELMNKLTIVGLIPVDVRAKTEYKEGGE